MTFIAKNFEHLIGTTGFSDALLKNHFTLYQAYVTNVNKLFDVLAVLTKEGKTGSPEFAELKRRFGWEFNGMRLHEYYFSNLTKNKNSFNHESNLGKLITLQFGSYEDWEKDFKATGAMRGIGWVILCLDPVSGKLFNVWINEHDVGHLCDAVPLLVMDVFEHAFMLDYGTKRADYIVAFFQTIDWTVVESHLSKIESKALHS